MDICIVKNVIISEYFIFMGLEEAQEFINNSDEYLKNKTKEYFLEKMSLESEKYIEEYIMFNKEILKTIVNYDNLIEKINKNEININDLDYETKMNVMKRSYQRATKENEDEEELKFFYGDLVG